MSVSYLGVPRPKYAQLFMVTRDVDSITQREVGLIVELIKEKYRNQLLYDELYLPEAEQIF
ncbi:MAG: hypothetical protein WA125_06630, partial [Desulfosporosinus sp.]